MTPLHLLIHTTQHTRKLYRIRNKILNEIKENHPEAHVYNGHYNPLLSELGIGAFLRNTLIYVEDFPHVFQISLTSRESETHGLISPRYKSFTGAWAHTIATRIKTSTLFISCLSRNILKSQNCEREIYFAVKTELTFFRSLLLKVR